MNLQNRAKLVARSYKDASQFTVTNAATSARALAPYFLIAFVGFLSYVAIFRDANVARVAATAAATASTLIPWILLLITLSVGIKVMQGIAHELKTGDLAICAIALGVLAPTLNIFAHGSIMLHTYAGVGPFAPAIFDPLMLAKILGFGTLLGTMLAFTLVKPDTQVRHPNLQPTPTKASNHAPPITAPADTSTTGPQTPSATAEAPAETSSMPAFVTRVAPKQTLQDYAGGKKLKAAISQWHLLAMNQDVMHKYGLKGERGMLLYGPTGTGKTYFAECVAGEFQMPLLTVKAGELEDKYHGVGEKRVAEMFAYARRQSPCILFIDEVENLIVDRRSLGDNQSYRAGMVNAFLAELDGITANNEGVLLLAATNNKDHIDSAAIRPGRIGAHQFVGPADVPTIASLIRIKMKGLKSEPGIDYHKVAKCLGPAAAAEVSNRVDAVKMRHAHAEIDAKRRRRKYKGKVTEAELITEFSK